LISQNNKTAYISNTLDFSNDLKRRRQSEKSDIEQLVAVGLDVEKLDLRDYFTKSGKLVEKIDEFGVIWVKGGNVFVLRQAMKTSGYDKLLQKVANERNDLLYGGYSVGVCVLTPSLRGIDLMDDITIFQYPEQQEVVWDGLNLINYSIVPHYKSDLEATHLTDKTVAQYERDCTILKLYEMGK